MTSRSAVTCWTCHHARTCGSALAAANSFSSPRLPRVGASTLIASIASAGGRGAASARWLRDSLIEGNVSGAEDLPGIHVSATCALDGPQMLRRMYEHQLRI